MHPVFVFYVFHESSQKFVEVAKTKNPIRYARFGPLRDPPLAASRMRLSIVFYVFHESSQKFVKVAKKSTEKLRFLQVAKGRVVQKYISILEENTAWMRYQRVSKYLLHLIWVHKNSIMNIQSWCSISSIFFPAPFPNAFIPVCDIKLLI